MTEKQKILLSLIFLAAFGVYVILFRLLYQAMIEERSFFQLALCNIGFSLFGVTLTGFIAIDSSDVKPRKLLAFSRVFFILSIVSGLSFFALPTGVTGILAMSGFLWGLGALITNLAAIPLFYKKANYWIYLTTEILWAVFVVYSMQIAAEISASC